MFVFDDVDDEPKKLVDGLLSFCVVVFVADGAVEPNKNVFCCCGGGGAG